MQHIKAMNIETAARGFQVRPSSDTRFLVTTSRGSNFIVTLPDVGSLHY